MDFALVSRFVCKRSFHWTILWCQCKLGM